MLVGVGPAGVVVVAVVVAFAVVGTAVVVGIAAGCSALVVVMT